MTAGALGDSGRPPDGGMVVEAQVHRVDQVSGARLVGGEMLAWSDLASRPSPGVAEQLVGRLVPASGSLGAVLLVGARAAQLVERLPAATTVDVLVRGLPDARTLAVAAKLRSGITVHCGTFESFDPDRTFDLVVDLDGPDHVVSPDGQPITQAALLARLAGYLTPEGQLVACVANELGVEELFRLDVASRRDDDSAWGWEAPGEARRPLYRRELEPALEAAGLVAVGTYAVVPSSGDATLVVTSECAADPVVGPVVAALGAAVLANHYTERPALADPYDLARRYFESGEIEALAPAWLVVARRAAATTATPPLPALLTVESGLRDVWAVTQAVVDTGEGYAWEVRPVAGRAEMRERSVVRLVEKASFDAVSGESLEAQLRRASQHHDIATVRRLVQAYDRWIRSAGAGQGDDFRFFAVPANVVVTDQAFSPLDGSWALSTRLSDDVLVVHGLRDFASRLLGAGSEHPWAPDTSPDSLSRTLAAMASLVVQPGVLEEVARLEAEVRVVLRGGDAVEESVAFAGNLQAGRSQFVAQSGPTRGYREAVAAGTRLAEELAARSAKVEWLEATLAMRDRQVDSLERQLGSVWASASFKIGRFFTWPVRGLVQGLRRVVYSVIPMDMVKRAEAALRRFLTRS
jgi:hypothetical protein